ncbi:MAG: RHS repeat-associated core domain-containing protein [Vicinamibacterales bacterium]
MRQTKSGTAGSVDFLVDRNDATGDPQILRATAPGGDRSFVYGEALLETRDPGSTLYRLVDHLGSTLSLTAANGTVTDTFDYDAYGSLLGRTGTSTAPHRYAGEESDAESGLTYLRARYYDPATGSFLSRDPSAGDLSDPSTLNPYPYAGGNPVNRTDLSGNDYTLNEVSVAEQIEYSQNAQEFYNKRQALATAKQEVLQAMRNLGGILAINAVVETFQDGGRRAKYWFGFGKIGLSEASVNPKVRAALPDLFSSIGQSFGNIVETIAVIGMGKTAMDMLERQDVRFFLEGTAGILLSSSYQDALQQLKDDATKKVSANCKPGALAAAYPGTFDIVICTHFFDFAPIPTVEDLTTANASSQSGTMLHEFSDASLGTDDLAYGCETGRAISGTWQSGAKAYASRLPGFALVNADSYRCWGEDAYLGYTGSGAAKGNIVERIPIPWASK